MTALPPDTDRVPTREVTPETDCAALFALILFVGTLLVIGARCFF